MKAKNSGEHVSRCSSGLEAGSTLLEFGLRFLLRDETHAQCQDHRFCRQHYLIVEEEVRDGRKWEESQTLARGKRAGNG